MSPAGSAVFSALVALAALIKPLQAPALNLPALPAPEIHAKMSYALRWHLA